MSQISIPKSYLIYVLALVVLIGIGAFVWSSPSQSVDAYEALASADELSVPESSWNYGTVEMKNGPVTKMVELINNATDPILVSDLYTSCGCTKARLVRDNDDATPWATMPGHGIQPTIEELIQPGEKVEIEVVFDPAAHGPKGVGNISRNVFLELNQDPNERIELNFTATVTSN
ncbi:MAG: DUF1573 domain-containing protein [Candidatus Uhrbacteria bacterium]|nr:DUF1573 domain-containing protein [Patescibacteria group bacterium]MBU1907018.1 DUF1573 domain-containing protein [Patescibacteria group bacterium]